MIRSINRERRYLLYLLILYFLSQGLVLFVSGFWHDDWAIMNISIDGLKKWASEMGRPERFVFFYMVGNTPEFIYKSITFFSHFVVVICIYLVVNRFFLFDLEESFTVAILYMCIPVNDARIERLTITYTLGLTLFWLAFTFIVFYYEEKKMLFRIVSPILFFFSYMLNSLLVFMIIVWLYVIIKEKCLKGIIRKIDLFLIPFIYFFIDQVFFPSHGVYAEYNHFSLNTLFNSVSDTFFQCCAIISEIFTQFAMDILGNSIILILFLLSTIAFSEYLKKKNSKRDDNCISIIRKPLVELMVGGISLFAGLFPYVVVGNTIALTGFDSRNAILVPFGVALIMHAIFRMGLKREYRIAISLFLMIVSLFFFWDRYSDYQRIYYCDKGMQVCLSNNPDLKKYKNIGLFRGDGGTSWYIYNGIFEEVYGDESRLVENINYIMKYDPSTYSECVEREWYNMTGFDITYDKVDCVIVYWNAITKKDALLVRFKELLGKNIEDDLLAEAEFKVIYPTDKEFSDYIMQ